MVERKRNIVEQVVPNVHIYFVPLLPLRFMNQVLYLAKAAVKFLSIVRF